MSSSLNAPLEADYVIIGGGTSGLVLASRLSENDSTRSVIVLEAGKNSSMTLVSKHPLFGQP